MKYLMTVAIAVGLVSNAYADSSPTIVRYHCDKEKDQVVIEYIAENKQNLGRDEWDPWKLVTIVDGHIKDASAVSRTCLLATGKYTVFIGPNPGNTDMDRRCGA